MKLQEVVGGQYGEMTVMMQSGGQGRAQVREVEVVT